MAVGKTAGRVYIRVIPDSRKFRDEMKKMLVRVEATISGTIRIDADLDSAERALNKFKRDWDGKKVDLAAGMSTLGAAAQLKLFTRERFIKVSVRLGKASLAKAGTALAALSGGRVVEDVLSKVGNQLANLDKNLPKIAAVANGVAALGSVALSSVGGLITLGGGLAKLAGLAPVLPGLLAGLAVGAGVFAIALSDTKNQLADLAPDFQNLRSIVVDNFWGVAAQPIRDFVTSVLPGLQTGLGRTAATIGGWSASIIQSLKSALGGGVIDALFTNLVDSINIASTGTGGFVQALVTLGGVGGQYLPRLAQWAADLSNRFAAFIDKVANNGALTSFIEDGINAAKTLYDAIGAIGHIFSGLFSATEKASSGGGLSAFASAVQSIANVVNLPGFQTALPIILKGASDGAAGIAAALGPIGALLQSLSGTIQQILSSSGSTLGSFLSSIAEALSSPAFSSGLGLFFSGLQTGIAAVAPALPALASALGTFLSFAGLLASNVGPLLGTVLAAVAPIFTTILQAVEPLMPVLSTALAGAVTALMPLLLSVMQLLSPIIAGIVGFVPVVLTLVQTLATALAPVFDQLVAAITPLIPIIFGLVSTLLPPLIGVVLQVVQAFAPFLGVLLTMVAQLLPPLISFIGGLLGAIVQLVPPLLTLITPFLTLGKTLLPALLGLFQALLPSIMLLVNVLVSALVPIFNLLAPIIGAVISAVNALLVPLLSLLGPILGPLIDIFTLLLSVALEPLIKIIGFITPMLQLLSPIFDILGAVITALAVPIQILGAVFSAVVKTIVALIKGDFSGIADIWSGLWENIQGIVKNAWNSVLGFIESGINGAITMINGLIGGINSVGGGIGIHLSLLPPISLPRLQFGADVSPRPGGTLAVLGEGGRKETVTDYGRTNQLIQLSAVLARRALAVGGESKGGDTFHITEVTDAVGTSMAIQRRQSELGKV